jgi:hypothetical protein
MEKNLDHFKELSNNYFGFKMLEFFVPDRGFGAFDSGSGMDKLGSRIRDKIGSLT